GVDVLAWESFGAGWVTDIKSQLKMEDMREFTAPYGQLPDLDAVDSKTRDLVFTWNGTTSGVCLPGSDWIADDRQGLALCDATSALFAMDVHWRKLDVVTWSWQKALGGEGGHGMLALSPRAIERLETWTPVWPLPKIFRLASKGKVSKGLFSGATINTPSLLAVEDQLDALAWAKEIGGLPALIERSKNNLAVISDWVAATSWVDFLAEDPACRSSTSICLKIVAEGFGKLDEDAQRNLLNNMTALLEDEGVAWDIGSYRDAPPGLRIWGGGTVEASDIKLLLPWLDWAWQQVNGKQ
ncbi:MAG: phosphoserine transaminase, partial [Pseudomonadales bacterium]